MMFAPGIKNKEDKGDLSKLQIGQLLNYVIQSHNAKKAGKHFDIRVGNKDLGLYSWASRSPLPEDKEKNLIARTSLHDYDYGNFEGTIPSGYGAGTVKKHDEGKILITNITPSTISFSTAHKKHPVRYSLINPKNNDEWLAIKQNTPELPTQKLHYKQVEVDNVKSVLEKLPKFHSQRKIDGALSFINIDNKGRVEMLSPRISKITHKPVVQTEKFFGHIPHLDIPKNLRNSVLRGEIQGYVDGKEIPLQKLNGILNSSLMKALTENKDIKLKATIFDVAKIDNTEIGTDVPYSARQKMIKELFKVLPKGKFEIAKSVSSIDDTIKLLETAKKNKEEGIVIHPETGLPLKAKIFPESDVFIRSIFPATQGSKYENTHAGGFNYSITKDGPIVGKVGSGLTDETRKAMHEDPNSFIGRTARIRSQGQFDKTTSHRTPAFLGLHEDYGPLNPPKVKKAEAYTYIDPKFIDSIKQRGLMSGQLISQDPELFEQVIGGKTKQKQFLARLKGFHGFAHQGPNIMFQLPPDKSKLSPKNPIINSNLIPIKVQLEKLLKDIPETKVHGMELVPYGQQKTHHDRHRILTSEEIKKYLKSKPDDIWKNYSDPDNHGFYASNVPHAAILTPTGTIDPKYLKF